MIEKYWTDGGDSGVNISSTGKGAYQLETLRKT